MPEVLATLSPSAPRRCVGSGTLLALAGLLLALAVLRPPAAPLLTGLLLVLAAASAYIALWLWRATAVRLELTAEALRDSAGTILAPLDLVTGVSRGAFALKPSNGFTLLLSEPAPRAWAPGLWWRFGRRLGVGGVTSGPEARFMAETIDGLLAARRAGN